MNLLETNARSRLVRGKDILIYGSCVEVENPEIFGEFSEGKVALSLCPERDHINLAYYKLAILLPTIRSVTVLTKDGSPHCVQIHYIVEELSRKLGVPARFFVVYEGKPREISPKAIKTSRYLAKVERLLNKEK